MSCGKCGKWSGKGTMLCPFSFGLAIGIVSFFAVLFWSLWVMKYGMPPMMEAAHMPIPTLADSFVHGLLALIKGFVFGFFVALIYDLIRCCCRKKSDESCNCTCGCCSPQNKGEVVK